MRLRDCEACFHFQAIDFSRLNADGYMADKSGLIQGPFAFRRSVADSDPSCSPIPTLGWARIHAELRRPGVTLMLLWEEYRGGQPDGYGYSRFCDLARGWRGRLSPTMRQTHPAGERLFVDYAGQTMEVIDGAGARSGGRRSLWPCWARPNFTYAEARWTQSLPDWIGCHVGAFAAMGGVARQIVCDNLKAGVTAASRYEPGISRTYHDMASHYGTAILPARVRKPRTKAAVEAGVRVPQSYILGHLAASNFAHWASVRTYIAPPLRCSIKSGVS